MIALRDFVPRSQRTQFPIRSSREVDGGIVSFDCNTAAIFGPPHSGKTTLLFVYALSQAEHGVRSLLLCSKRQIEESKPLLPCGVESTSPLLRFIEIKYVSTYLELRQVLAAIHLRDNPPSLLLIDNIVSHLDPGLHFGKAGEEAIVKLLAMAYSAMESLGRKMIESTQLLVTVDSGEEPPSLYIYQRWLHLILRIQKDEARETYNMRVVPSLHTKDSEGVVIEYDCSDTFAVTAIL